MPGISLLTLGHCVTCFSSMLKNGSTCYGDSGGPTFWVDPDTGDETGIVVAITSWGDVPCVATGIAYRVDTSDTLHFIAEMAEEWLEQP
ncbi:MAG: trypsin-like serine protease [Deltaproteobacteria bacterium]|nr:trypsin-like serine protease [Deltaproteobacteria bacterium]